MADAVSAQSPCKRKTVTYLLTLLTYRSPSLLDKMDKCIASSHHALLLNHIHCDSLTGVQLCHVITAAAGCSRRTCHIIACQMSNDASLAAVSATNAPVRSTVESMHACRRLLASSSIMPNTHRRRRRDETVLSRRRRRCVHEFETSWRQFRRVVGVNTPVGSRVPVYNFLTSCADK